MNLTLAYLGRRRPSAAVPPAGRVAGARTCAATASASSARCASRCASARPSAPCTTSSSATCASTRRTTRPTGIPRRAKAARGRRAARRARREAAPAPADAEGRRRCRRAAGASSDRCARATGTPARNTPTTCCQHDPDLWRHARAVRPGDHRRARRPLLRVLQRRREQLRLPDRRPRRLRPREHDVPSARPTSITRWALYEHFQKLRSYRETRFLIDPRGFEVQTRAGGRLSRGEDRPAAELAARVHAAPVGDEPAAAAGARSAAKGCTTSWRS